MLTKQDLGEPFASAQTIDFKTTSPLSDHKYLEALGYHITMGADCSCSCELVGLSVSSYGDWGTIYSWADELTWQIFLDMVEKRIIKLWRCDNYNGKREGGLF